MTCRKMGVTGNQMFSEISQESGQLPCIFLSSTEARFKIKYYICVCVCVCLQVCLQATKLKEEKDDILWLVSNREDTCDKTEKCDFKKVEQGTV